MLDLFPFQFKMCLCWPQVSCWPEDIHPQWNEGQLGEGESREANEAQRAGDMGTAGQSGGQQGRHLGEAHRSAEHIQTGILTIQQLFERTGSTDFTIYTRIIEELNILLVNMTNITNTANNNFYKLQLCYRHTPLKKWDLPW